MKKLLFRNYQTYILTISALVAFILSIGLIVYGIYKHCDCCIALSSFFIASANIIVVVLLAYTVSIVDDSRVKFAAICDVRARHQEKIYRMYENLMDSPSRDNQQAYDQFRDELDRYFYDLIMVDPQWEENESYKWWSSELQRINNHYITDPDYDFCELSRVWSPQINKLYTEIYKMYFS